jgi:uncharacterized membrane protein (DUF373 family)
MLRKITNLITDNATFLRGIGLFEKAMAKVLSVGLLAIVLLSMIHLGYALVTMVAQEISNPQNTNFDQALFQIFGLILNVLIALEILENVTAYLKQHVLQAELVLVTALIAVARKIILLDLEKKDSGDLIALGVAIICLSFGYLLVRFSNRRIH